MNTNIFNYPVVTFLDDNGIPLSGGMIYTYAAGTSTPQAVYADAAGTPQTNPVILDSAGRAQIWLDASRKYRVVVTDSTGATIAGLCADNIGAPSSQNVTQNTTVITGGTSGGPVALTSNGLINVLDYISHPADKNNVSQTENFTTANGAAESAGKSLYIPEGIYYLETNPNFTVPVVFAPDAQLRIASNLTLPIHPIITDYRQHFALAANTSARVIFTGGNKDVFPEWFGAVGNGSSDDTYPLSHAIISCASGQRVVLNSAKTYVCGSLTLLPGSYLCGSQSVDKAGATLLFNGTTGDILSITGTDGVQGVTLRDLIIDGNGSASNGINLNTSGSLIERCTVRNINLASGAGILLVGTANYCGLNEIRDCSLYSCAFGIANATTSEKVTDGEIINCTIAQCQKGIYLGVADGWKILDNSISLCNTHVALNGDRYLACRNVLDNIGSGTNGYGFYLTNTDHKGLPTVISNNVITARSVDGVIAIYGSNDVGAEATICDNVVNCAFAPNSCTGIQVSATFAGAIVDNLLAGFQTLYSPATVERTAIFRSQIAADYGNLARALRTSISTTIGTISTGDKTYKIQHIGNTNPEGNISGQVGDIAVLHISADQTAKIAYLKSTDSGNTGWKPIAFEDDKFRIEVGTARRIRIGTVVSFDESAQLAIGRAGASLGGTAANNLLILADGGNCAPSGTSNLWRRHFLVRDTAGTDSGTAVSHDCLGYDANNIVPRTGTRCWWERNPTAGTHKWGDIANTNLTLDASGNATFRGNISSPNYDNQLYQINVKINGTGNWPIYYYRIKGAPAAITMFIPRIYMESPPGGAMIITLASGGNLPFYNRQLIRVITNTAQQPNSTMLLKLESKAQWVVKAMPWEVAPGTIPGLWGQTITFLDKIFPEYLVDIRDGEGADTLLNNVTYAKQSNGSQTSYPAVAIGDTFVCKHDNQTTGGILATAKGSAFATTDIYQVTSITTQPYFSYIGQL